MLLYHRDFFMEHYSKINRVYQKKEFVHDSRQHFFLQRPSTIVDSFLHTCSGPSTIVDSFLQLAAVRPR